MTKWSKFKSRQPILFNWRASLSGILKTKVFFEDKDAHKLEIFSNQLFTRKKRAFIFNTRQALGSDLQEAQMPRWSFCGSDQNLHYQLC